MSKSQHAKAVAAEVQRKMSSSDSSDVIWGFIEGYSAFFDGVSGASVPVLGIASNVVKVMQAARGSGPELLDNPYFIGNGHGEDDPSAKTARYLRNRNYKGMGANVASTAGAIGSAFTAVDVAGIALHGNAVGTTGAHLKVYADMARRSRKTGTVAEWLDLVIRMKALKMTSRGSSLIGSAVPIPAVGITTGVIAAAVATGAKLTLTKACTAAALELHWRAKQEQVISGMLGATGGTIGPASRIVWELFTKRGMTRVLGKHDTAKLMNEPAGWMAIQDKLLLI